MTRETKSYELKIYDQSLMKFEAAYDAFGSLKLEITDIDSANAHLLPLNLIVDQDEKSLASWMEGRTIPKNRAFVEQILSTAGLTRNDILGILDVSKGLSINDSYWLDDGKSDVTFDEINLFDNRFDEVLGLVAYTGYTPSQKHKAGVSSEWTLGGQFPKAVRRINDRLLLFKTGTSGARNLGKEPYSEYFAAQVAKRMGIDHVSYDLEMWKGKLASVCGLMNDKEISFVPFFVAAGDASFPAALSILNELDPKMASKYRTMVVFDALICNRDRHGGNFGILRENRTGRLLGLAPVFDHNLSLFAQDDETEATRLKGEADGAAEKAHGEGVAAGIKAQTEAYNGMENAYLLANRYIDVMPEVAEAVAKPLTAVDSIKMYGDGNATKLVRDTTGMVDQVTSGLKDATGIDLTELLSSFHQPFQPREDNE